MRRRDPPAERPPDKRPWTPSSLRTWSGTNRTSATPPLQTVRLRRPPSSCQRTRSTIAAAGAPIPIPRRSHRSPYSVSITTTSRRTPGPPPPDRRRAGRPGVGGEHHHLELFDGFRETDARPTTRGDGSDTAGERASRPPASRSAWKTLGTEPRRRPRHRARELAERSQASRTTQIDQFGDLIELTQPGHRKRVEETGRLTGCAPPARQRMTSGAQRAAIADASARRQHRRRPIRRPPIEREQPNARPAPVHHRNERDGPACDRDTTSRFDHLQPRRHIGDHTDNRFEPTGITIRVVVEDQQLGARTLCRTSAGPGLHPAAAAAGVRAITRFERNTAAGRS